MVQISIFKIWVRWDYPLTYYYLHSLNCGGWGVVAIASVMISESLWLYFSCTDFSLFNIWVGWRRPINLLYNSCLWHEGSMKEHNILHYSALFFLRWSATGLLHNSSYGHQINRKCQTTTERIMDNIYSAERHGEQKWSQFAVSNVLSHSSWHTK